uniref:Uncharacterized protein n=1 Tax=Gossypium raimondii TaxID=29730 RepID=A0A0D2TM57_GOSRA|nr:hypothetical protein B456_007G268100 [Gossypium raimondii]
MAAPTLEMEPVEPQSLKKLSLKSLKRTLDLFSPIHGQFAAPNPERAIEHPTFSALTRPLCDLYSLIPPLLVVTHKKLRFNMGNDVLSFGDLNVYGSWVLLVMSLRALMEVIKGKLLVFMVLKIGVKLVALIPCLLIMG